MCCWVHFSTLIKKIPPNGKYLALLVLDSHSLKCSYCEMQDCIFPQTLVHVFILFGCITEKSQTCFVKQVSQHQYLKIPKLFFPQETFPCINSFCQKLLSEKLVIWKEKSCNFNQSLQCTESHIGRFLQAGQNGCFMVINKTNTRSNL